VLPGAEAEYLEADARPDYLGVVFGRAFLVAIQQRDRERAIVFAKALLTRFQGAASHPR